ncbi:MAG TPA: hypothetical protein VGH97_03825 [Thermoanaerobaculia bacterium]|jgi:hypothetical protein
MTRRRRLLALLLLATSLAGATTAHHHPILEDASGARCSAPQLAARCQLSGELSLHAVSRIVERDVCWSCHWNRHFGPPPGSVPAPRPDAGRPLATPAFADARVLALFSVPSRGPPPSLL